MDMSSQAFESSVEDLKQRDNLLQGEVANATAARQAQSNRADTALEQVCSACQGSLGSRLYAFWVQEAFELFDTITQSLRPTCKLA